MSELRLRMATRDDVRSLAELHVQTFNETHGPGPSLSVRESQWREAFEADGQNWFCVLGETRDGRLVGFAKGQPYAEQEHGEFKGELNKIYVLREHQRRGLGRQLLCAVARGLLSRAIGSMLLFGDARSTSNGFYERMGAERIFAPNGQFHGGYGWRDLSELSKNCGTSGDEEARVARADGR